MAKEPMKKKEGVGKSQPTSSQVHVPVAGEEEKLKKEKHSLKNISEIKRSLEELARGMDLFLDEEASEEDAEKSLDSQDVDADPDMYPGINNLEGGALKSDEEDEPNSISDLQDAQELISGIDWETESENVDPLTARELAWDNLEQDPLYYRKKRLAQESTSDQVDKDTQEGEESSFSGEGYNDEALEKGLWIDLGSGNCRESGHIGFDLYPYDYGTAVHDLDLGLPLPDGSVSKARYVNVLGHESAPDVKALLSEVHRVLMPGGQFVYEGPEEIHNYPEWAQDYPGLVLFDHEDNSDGVEKVEGSPLLRQKFTRIATPDPATSNDAEPRIGIAQYDMLPADALLNIDAQGYYWSDSTSSGRGNRLMGYPSQGALLNKQINKGGPGSGRHPEGGGKKGQHNSLQLQRAMSQAHQSSLNIERARQEHINAPRENKEKALANLKQALIEHQGHMNNLMNQNRIHQKSPIHQSVEKSQKIGKVMPILKADSQKQIVYGVVLAPNEVDSQDDYMEPEDIEKTAHDYLARSRVIGSGHEKQIQAYPVESYICPADIEFVGQNGPQMVKKGSWILGVKVPDPKEWQKVLNGEYTGFSVGGKGLREER
jgi:hypothetical protein